VRTRALTAWGWKRGASDDLEADEVAPPGWIKARDDALPPVILHGARHTFASFLIAAGCNVKTVSTLVGHASGGHHA
jgi:integrase